MYEFILINYVFLPYSRNDVRDMPYKTMLLRVL